MKCKFLGKAVKKTCCAVKSTYECERLELHVVPAVDCEECRFWSNAQDRDTDVILPDQLQATFDSVKPIDGYYTGEGDGIIYVGEGKYWPGIVVGIRMLRKVGCKLPIEVWYRGKSGEVFHKDIEGIANVRLIDLDEMSNRLGDNKIPPGNPKSGGWEAKLYAATHTRFSRYLYMDADAYVVYDPTSLFNLLDSSSFVYWRDLPTQVKSIKWKQVFPQGESLNIPPIQGGQLLIDREYGWRLINLAHFLCQNSHYYFRYMYGDQDAWRVAVAMESTRRYDFPKLYRCIGVARWVEPAFICSYDERTDSTNDKKPIIIHRCRGKLFRLKDIPQGKVKYSNPQYFLPREQEVFNEFAAVLNNGNVKHHTTAGEAFGDIYAQKLWGGTSGRGSEEQEARLYIDTVNHLIKANGWKTVIDCGSGDGNIASQLKCEKYVGYDCCYDVVRAANKRHPICTFVHLDIYRDVGIIQSGDVLLCKDVLHHWPNEWVTQWLKALTQSKKWKMIILTQDREQLDSQIDCHLGGYRALNHKLPPLNQFTLERIAGVYHKDMYALT